MSTPMQVLNANDVFLRFVIFLQNSPLSGARLAEMYRDKYRHHYSFDYNGKLKNLLLNTTIENNDYIIRCSSNGKTDPIFTLSTNNLQNYTVVETTDVSDTIIDIPINNDIVFSRFLRFFQSANVTVFTGARLAEMYCNKYGNSFSTDCGKKKLKDLLVNTPHDDFAIICLSNTSTDPTFSLITKNTTERIVEPDAVIDSVSKTVSDTIIDITIIDDNVVYSRFLLLFQSSIQTTITGARLAELYRNEYGHSFSVDCGKKLKNLLLNTSSDDFAIICSSNTSTDPTFTLISKNEPHVFDLAASTDDFNVSTTNIVEYAHDLPIVDFDVSTTNIVEPAHDLPIDDFYVSAFELIDEITVYWRFIDLFLLQPVYTITGAKLANAYIQKYGHPFSVDCKKKLKKLLITDRNNIGHKITCSSNTSTDPSFTLTMW